MSSYCKKKKHTENCKIVVVTCRFLQLWLWRILTIFNSHLSWCNWQNSTSFYLYLELITLPQWYFYFYGCRPFFHLTLLINFIKNCSTNGKTSMKQISIKIHDIIKEYKNVQCQFSNKGGRYNIPNFFFKHFIIILKKFREL